MLLMNYKTVAILLILIVGVIGYWIGAQKQKPSATTAAAIQNSTEPVATPNSIQAQSETQQTATPVSTPDPTLGWKIYSNTKYGYSVKYPTTATFYEDNTYYHYVYFKRADAPQGEFPIFYTSAIKDDFVARSPVSVNYMSADVINDLYKLRIGENKTMDTSTMTRISDRSIGGETALSLKVKATGINQDRYYIKHGGNIYMFVSDNSTEEFQNFLNNIKFTK